MAAYRVTLTLDFDIQDLFALTDVAFPEMARAEQETATTGHATIGDSEILLHIDGDQAPAALTVLVGRWVADHPPVLPGVSAEVGVGIHAEARPASSDAG